jgi:hypothetical protein
MRKREDGKYESSYSGEVMDEKDYFKWVKEITECDDEYNLLSQRQKDFIDSDEERAYRRGYRQGFAAAKNNPDLKISEVIEWSDGNRPINPPGSHFAGKKIFADDFDKVDMGM